MALVITIKVVPQAGRLGWELDKNQQLKCFLLSPAQDNKANQELIKLLSKTLKTPQNTIMIVRGATTRIKTLKIDAPLTLEQCYKMMGLEKQDAII